MLTDTPNSIQGSSGYPFTFAGTLTGSNNRTLNNNSNGPLILSGNVYLSETSSTAYTLTLGGSGTGGIVVNGVIANYATGAGTVSCGLTFSGSGQTLTLNNANTYTGATTVNGGTLNFGTGACCGTGGLVVNGIRRWSIFPASSITRTPEPAIWTSRTAAC